ncbi:MAG: hypothetical protein R2991_09655 [Thermoanaerobaculia bacterium]
MARAGAYLTLERLPARRRFGSPLLEGVGTAILIVTLINFCWRS